MTDKTKKETFKANRNPPPGAYDTSTSLTLSRGRSAFLNTGDRKPRSKFVESPIRENPSGGTYSHHLKPFGHGLKNPMTDKTKKYDYKESRNPPPGHYDLDSAQKLVKPKARVAVIKDVARYPVYD